MNIDNFIKKIDINNDKYIVIGVSSGPDSMALLHMLNTNLKCKLVCAHINHNVRKESEEEAIFVESFAKENNLIYEYMEIAEKRTITYSGIYGVQISIVSSASQSSASMNIR